MGKAEAAREAAIAAFKAADDAAEKLDRLAFEREFATGQEKFKQYRELTGQPEQPVDTLYDARQLLTDVGGAATDMKGQRVPWPTHSGGSGYVGERKSMYADSWGAAVVQANSQNGEFKSILTSGSTAVTVPLRADPITDARRAEFVRQLIPAEPAPGGQFSYLQQTVRTNNAAAVAKGAKKPTSVYTLARINDRTRTIAHLSEPIARQDVNDANLLRQFVDGELRYGLDLEVDDEILNGTGVGEEMTGIRNVTGIQTQAWVSDALTTTRKAVTKLQKVDLAASSWVFNPDDWESVELAAINQFASNPNLSAATEAMSQRLHGIPVLVSNAMTSGVAILGAFRTSAVLYTTEDAVVDWSENVYDPNALGSGQGASDFERNMLRFRAEGRWNIAVTRPLGFVEVEVGEPS